MCGRITQFRPWTELYEWYNLIGLPLNLQPHYNIPPTSNISVVIGTGQGNELVQMRWWLVPSWWRKELKDLPSTFNARSEGISDKPMFRGAVKSKRCIIPSDGFYEWKRSGKTKIPYFIKMKSGEPLSFAGIWDAWNDPNTGDILQSCSIITCDSNKAMEPIHSRMPVILDEISYQEWLVQGDLALLKPCRSEDLEVYEVDRDVNNVKNQSENLIQPVIKDLLL